MAFAILALMSALTAATPQEPAGYVLVPEDASQPSSGVKSLAYWNTAQAASAEAGEIEVELLYVTDGLRGSRPTSHPARYRISCDFGSERYQTAPGSWSKPRFTGRSALRWASDQACGRTNEAVSQPRLPTQAAAFEDGIGRLGYDSLEAVMQLPNTLSIQQSPFVNAAPSGEDRETYDLVYGPDEKHGAVFLRRAEGGTPEGRSFWMLGVDHSVNDRGYAVRDFRADCGSGEIAVASVATWPSYGHPRPQIPAAVEIPETIVDIVPPAESAAAALLGAVCSGADRTVSAGSIDELVAYAANPTVDPAFAARAQETISDDDMRWLHQPDPAEITAAYPDGALRPGESGLTTVKCVVTRDYTLSRCAPSYNSPPDRGLQEAHMSLVEAYVPARTSVTGEDTMGRTVELSIRWTPDRSTAKAQRIRPDQIVWTSRPSVNEIRRAYPSRTPGTAMIGCEVNAAHQLESCEIEGYMGAGGKAFSDAALTLIPRFGIGPLTTTGEDTAGRPVLIVLAINE